MPHNVPSFLGDEDVLFLSYNDLAQSQIKPSDRFSSSMIEQTTEEPTLEDIQSQVLDITTKPVYQEYLKGFHPLIRDFIDDQIKDAKDQFDFKYGITHNMEMVNLK